MCLNDKKLHRSKLWWIGIIGVLLVAGWWVTRPNKLFQLQVWLLTRGAWHNLEHWVNQGDQYLPFLISKSGDLTPVPLEQVSLCAGPGSFEAYTHLRVDTVSDCVRIVLHRIAGDDGVGFSFRDGTTNAERSQAARFWREWYARNKGKLRWDPQKKIFEIAL